MENDINNMAVVVSRWYDGTHIGPVRFTIMKECALEAMSHITGVAKKHEPTFTVVHDNEWTRVGRKGKKINKTRPEHPANVTPISVTKKCLLICSSIGDHLRVPQIARTDIEYTTKIRSLKIDEAKNAILQTEEKYQHIVLMVGSNDLQSMKGPWDIDNVKANYKALVHAAKESQPTGCIHVVELIPRHNIHSNIITGFNRYLSQLTAQENIKFVPTFGLFANGEDLYKNDRIHPNMRGTSTLAAAIIGSIRPRHIPPKPRMNESKTMMVDKLITSQNTPTGDRATNGQVPGPQHGPPIRTSCPPPPMSGQPTSGQSTFGQPLQISAPSTFGPPPPMSAPLTLGPPPPPLSAPPTLGPPPPMSAPPLMGLPPPISAPAMLAPQLPISGPTPPMSGPSTPIPSYMNWNSIMNMMPTSMMSSGSGPRAHNGQLWPSCAPHNWNYQYFPMQDWYMRN